MSLGQNAQEDYAARPHQAHRRNAWTVLWILSRIGLIAIGLGETFWPGILLLVLTDYCKFHGMAASALRSGDLLLVSSPVVAAVLFLAVNAWQKHWFLVAVNILGFCGLLAAVAIIVSAVDSTG